MSIWETLMERSQPSPSGCREWIRARDLDGYGMLRVDGRQRRAHRVAFAEKNGPIPEGIFIRHTCDNPPCINPDHLVIGTPRDNVHDMFDRGRNSDRRGEKCPTSVLTWPRVREIRSALNSGRSQSSLASQFGVSRKAISKIAHHETWREATEMDGSK